MFHVMQDPKPKEMADWSTFSIKAASQCTRPSSAAAITSFRVGSGFRV